MKLLALLFVCSRLLPSLTQESSQEIDCDDEDLFKAVDTALKKYNSRNQSGNQFVLYRVTEVVRTDDPDTFYSFKYQIREGNCSVQSGKTWQDCDYKESAQAATGECSATVGKRGNMKFSVATQTCQITPAEGPVVRAQYECLGCVHPISTASPDLEPVLRHAIEHFNNNTDHSHLFALREVRRAHRQVVAGWNYEITYSIAQTNCSKENFLFLTPDCKSLLNGDIGECTDHAHMDLQLRIASFSQKCELYPGEDFVQPPSKICPGCPRDIPVNSPELEVALNHSIAKLNAENNGTFHFKIDSVKRATVQVVAGEKFSIVFIARETMCSKESNEELAESCQINKYGQILECKAEVFVIRWEKKIYPTVNCQPLKKIMLMKRPPGFSPFRSVPLEKTEEGTTVSPPHTSMAPVQDEERDSGKEHGHTHGHGWGHYKQIKHGFGHGHKHEHDQGHGYHRGRGLGHGHQKQHGLGHEHPQELNYDLEHRGRHGLGHGHQREHGLAHGHIHEHGQGHGKYKNKRKNDGKHNGWKTEHLASSSEASTTSSAQTQEKTEGPTPLPSLAQPDTATAVPDFQDSDLIAAVIPKPPAPTESDDDWIPDIQIEPNSLSFNLISDFPEKTSPRCPGRPWKPVNGMNPAVEVKEFHDFDLTDAFF
ncbi:kininogen-1 isoform X1 [Mirounga leonina]|uniref:kininogen-1 isoform X1 n=1 Tax=Mirounga leonina TaxID=9715 RepID=UPI00156BF05F|nr:kininogen-1 isoform X1 [Mirounga leonina]